MLLDFNKFHHPLRWHGKPAKPLAEFCPDDLNHTKWLPSRMSPFNLVGRNPCYGTAEQSIDGGHAELCCVEHARDGLRSHGFDSFRAASQYAASAVRSGGQFCRDATWCARAGQNALARGTLWCRLLLLGCAAGAPFLPKLAELAKGNLAFAVGVMVLLMVTTVVYLPIVLPLLLPG